MSETLRTSGPVTVVLGTRPEAIKLAPVILSLRQRSKDVRVVATGQHRDLVAPVLALFGLEIDHDLALMKPRQSLDHVLTESILRVGQLLDDDHARLVVVQGDTTSSLGAGLAAFHRGIPVAHVEAGLRSGDLAGPFPEELNRKAIDLLSHWHFAPTETSANNLRAEGIVARVEVTGNTVVDAVRYIAASPPTVPEDIARFVADKPYILATAHRRESWDGGIERIAKALAEVADRHPDLRILFAVHPNPRAREPIDRILGDRSEFLIVDPLDYATFIGVLRGALLAVSDSGGVQEEGPTLGVPVLVTRRVTERPEGIAAGAARLVGTDTERIVAEANRLIDDPRERTRMTAAGRTVYGDGHAADRIASQLVDGDDRPS